MVHPNNATDERMISADMNHQLLLIKEIREQTINVRVHGPPSMRRERVEN